MKKLSLFFVFAIGFHLAVSAQDLTIDKGSGWLYFTGVPGTVPDPACCAEVAINRTTREAYIWNIGDGEWQRWYGFSQGSSNPSGDPGTAPYSYLNRTTGTWWKWTGSAWGEVGGTTIVDASDVPVIVQNGVAGPSVQDELEDLRADLISGGDGWGSDVVETSGTGLTGDGTVSTPLALNDSYVQAIAGIRQIALTGTGETTMRLRYYGNATPTLVKTGAGNFTLTFPAGTAPVSFQWAGNNTNLDGGNAINLLIVSGDGNSEYFNAAIRAASTGNIANLALLGVVIDQDLPSAGNMDATLTNMNGFGASGFTIIANF